MDDRPPNSYLRWLGCLLRALLVFVVAVIVPSCWLAIMFHRARNPRVAVDSVAEASEEANGDGENAHQTLFDVDQDYVARKSRDIGHDVSIVGDWGESWYVKWSAPLGTAAFATPVVVDGMVWIGTNDGNRESPKGVLACYRESDGLLLYRYESPPFPNQMNRNFFGIGCSPLVEGDRIWFTTNRDETLCLDIGPLKRGDGPPREIWKLDMREKLGVFPRAIREVRSDTVPCPDEAPSRTCSIAAYRDFIYVTTGNGVNHNHRTVPKPNAPSLVCLHKGTGEVVWQDNSPGKNILPEQFASPLVIETDGRPQVIAPQSDGWLRSFNPQTGELIWQFDMNRKEVHGVLVWGDWASLLATPVFYGSRVYMAIGRGLGWGTGPGRLCCIDPNGTGDVSSELAVDAAGRKLPHRRFQAVNPKKGERAIPNPNSRLIWAFTDWDDDLASVAEREQEFEFSMSNVAIEKDRLITAATSGFVYCLDADTGQQHWWCDVFSSIAGSPLIVHGHVFVADEDGEVKVLPLEPDLSSSKKRRWGWDHAIATIEFPASIYASPTYANGVLYVATRDTLYAIECELDSE